MNNTKSRDQILAETRDKIKEYNEKAISFFDGAGEALESIFQIYKIEDGDIKQGLKEFIDNYNASIDDVKSTIADFTNINGISNELDRLKAELHHSGAVAMIGLNASSAIANACFSVLCVCAVANSKPEARKELLKEFLESAASKMRAARANEPEELALRDAIEAERQSREIVKPWKMAEEILDSVNLRLAEKGFPPVNADRIYRRLKSTSLSKNAEEDEK
jgi:hypothetical protein